MLDYDRKMTNKPCSHVGRMVTSAKKDAAPNPSILNLTKPGAPERLNEKTKNER